MYIYVPFFSILTRHNVIQGIPTAQQTLLFRDLILTDSSTLHECRVVHGSQLKLVLKVQSALASVPSLSEYVSLEDSGSDLLDLQSVEIFDVTGLDDGERDELLALLFSSSSRALVVCRDGDLLSFFKVQTPPSSTGESIFEGASDLGLPLRASSSPGSRDRVVSASRLRRWQENVSLRIKMAELRTRMRSKKKLRTAAAAVAVNVTGAKSKSNSKHAPNYNSNNYRNNNNNNNNSKLGDGGVDSRA